jgi:cyclomaltodextrinase
MTGPLRDGARDGPHAGPAWVRDAVFYQIFPDRFAISTRVPKPGPLEPWDAPPTQHGFKGGDLLGIAAHLDDLRDLGVTALYLTPVFASASNHRYHTFDYEIVDPLLGGDAALRELLDGAHRRGMFVVLDGVFNHASRGFWPFNHVLENGSASPYRDWFYLDPAVLDGRRGLVAYPGQAESDAMARIQSGAYPAADLCAAATPEPSHLPTASERVLGYQAWWDLPALPKLNHANPAVREYIFSIAERWLRFGIDGWRLDVPQEIAEPGFWEEFRRRCLAVNPQAYLVGEIWAAAPEWLAGDRFHAVMNYPLAEAIMSFVGGGAMDWDLVSRTHEYSQHVHAVEGEEFGRWLEHVMTTYSPSVTSMQLNLLDSHDTPRFLSLAGGDTAAVRLATLIQMTLPGAPCIYYGDEIGLEGREDPDCRRSYPWDPTRQDGDLRAFVAGLISLRRDQRLLRHGRFRLLGAHGSAVAYALEAESSTVPSAISTVPSAISSAVRQPPESIVIAINAGESPARLNLAVPHLTGCRLEQVSWPGRAWATTFAPRSLLGGVLEVELEAREGVVIKTVPVP